MGTGAGFYVYIEASPVAPGNKARLVSPIVQYSGSVQCLTFWYHMYGQHVDTLNVYVQTRLNLGSPVWSKNTTQGNVWRRAQVDVNAKVAFNIVFEGVRGIGYAGDISLDDIDIKPGYCQQGSTATPGGTRAPATVCDFENPTVCGFSQVTTGDQFDWTRAKGKTSSGGTGPNTDHTYNTDQGYYMYVEASSPRRNGDKAQLVSPVYSTTTQYQCLQFWYHMFGRNIGTLNVYLKVGAVTAKIWSETGDQGNKWYIASASIPPQNRLFQVVFEGVRGTGYQGDIAIDDYAIKSGACPVPGGYYIFVETSNPRKTGDAAQIESPTVTPGGQWRKCLRFWYHMYGAHVDKLNVYTKSVSLSKPIWTKQGTQGNAWKLAEIQLGITAQYTVVIEALRGPGWQGDIAIDDVTLSDGSCQPGGPIKFSTPNTFGYRNVFLDLSGVTSVSFKLKACSDGHIQLQPTKSSPEQMNYEAVIGGWSNTQSVIRDSKNGHVVTTKSKVLECGALKPFWISWDGGHIRVGQGLATGQGIFLDYINPTKFVVGGLAVSTGYGADGYWEINDPTGSGTKPLSTYCTFENGTCGWTQDTTGDQFDWILLGGSTGSGGTGPTTDHTYGTGAGNWQNRCHLKSIRKTMMPTS
ncbi:MAM and LDL-receptor class A domain-containing protein 1-like [Lingula anatina]|uniref:MAM and LDL-receptor class A domain-containing protein 1-like n=1 Tax=Lingula anatina TaxID=7574 RepID=A0A1S3IHS4_LINAN|nr:MAM and LDL-receptor class A domain-containing protein 1-like [Lingula anatina]|eukprot:XP_013397767.1 MAM and LDL-receptor class A domain-containing protein 1-like [Lingula anatina]